MSANAVFIILAIVCYLVGMIYIGYRHSKGTNNSADFYLGGRKLGPIVAAMSTEASDMSAYLLMGVPGLALFCGVAEAGWTAIGLAAGTYLNWLLVAKRLRTYSAKVDAITVPDYLARRFRDNTKLIETVGALVIIIFFVPYTASGFVACGKLFNTMFGWAYTPTMIVSAIVIVAYCTMGGFMAASITSLIQSLVMTFALIVVLIFGINTVGGWDAVIANAKTVPGYLDFFTSTNILSDSPGVYDGVTILSTLAWGLGYFGMPHVLIHFMAANDAKNIKTSRRIATSWVVIFSLPSSPASFSRVFFPPPCPPRMSSCWPPPRASPRTCCSMSSASSWTKRRTCWSPASASSPLPSSPCSLRWIPTVPSSVWSPSPGPASAPPLGPSCSSRCSGSAATSTVPLPACSPVR